MTTNNVSKFSLTIIAALVLAACGSSGSSKPNANSTNTTPSANKPAPAPKPTTDARNENHQDLSAALTADTAFTGAKHVVLVKSNLITNQNSDGEISEKSDKPEVLQVQDPHRSLDTIVVAETRGKDGKLIPDAPSFYLEDFDFRTDATAATAAATAGEKTLTHIYKGQTTTGGTARPETDTKTATQGADSGKALVYQTGRVNYLHNYNGAVVDNTGAPVANANANTQRDLKDTVAEVYGYRTFAEGANIAAAQTDIKDVAQANAPFLPTNHAQLKNVQYGRVTTQLSGQNIGTLKAGLPVGSLDTKVVGYGEYNKPGTENHYFYRGIDPTTADQLAKLKNAGSKKLSYAGHALTYGNIKPAPSASNIPTAIGVSGQLIEGTRVKATVNLDTNKVAGSLYNTWYIDKNARDIDVVTFEGTVGKSGSMYGTSTNLTNPDSKSGMFAATLYNKDASEMGGVVASDAHEPAKQWGAVFGAALTTEKATQYIGAAGNHEVTGK